MDRKKSNIISCVYYNRGVSTHDKPIQPGNNIQVRNE